MSCSRLCKVCWEFHDIEQPWPCFRDPGPNAAPNIRPDGMDAIQGQADGRMYDSKSAYYRSIRQAGCEIVGNDIGGFGPRPEYRPRNVGQDIKRTIEQLRSRG
jgi:hypothetical protein